MGRSGMSRSKGGFDNIWGSLAVNPSSPTCLASCRVWGKKCGKNTNIAWRSLKMRPKGRWMMAEGDE